MSLPAPTGDKGMSIRAVFEDGVFKPLQPVDLPDSERVELEIHRSGETAVPSQSGRTVWDRFGKGLLGPIPSDFKELGDEWREYME